MECNLTLDIWNEAFRQVGDEKLSKRFLHSEWGVSIHFSSSAHDTGSRSPPRTLVDRKSFMVLQVEHRNDRRCGGKLILLPQDEHVVVMDRELFGRFLEAGMVGTELPTCSSLSTVLGDDFEPRDFCHGKLNMKTAVQKCCVEE